MLKRQLVDLFQNYDEPIKEIILEVIAIEQESITEPNPRITPTLRKQIDGAVARQAKYILNPSKLGSVHEHGSVD